MKKLNELQSYLTRLRGLMLTLIILCSIGVGNAWGDYSIAFKSYNDSGNESTTIAKLIDSGSDYISSITASKTSRTTSDGLKFGNNNNPGSLTLVMKSTGSYIGQIKASKITVKNIKKQASNGGDCQYEITYAEGGSTTGTLSLSTTASDKDINLTSTKTIESIHFYNNNKKEAFYMTGFTVVAAAAASCGLPTSPSNGAKTATTQPVSWTAPGSAPANGYVVAVCATNTTPNTNVTITNGNAYWSGDYYYAHIAAGTRNYTFSTTSGAYLTAGTTYYWWVRSKCGASDYSAWVAGSSFIIPNIAVSTDEIDGMDYVEGSGPSSPAKTFTVSGTGLTGNLTVALDGGSSSNFEISKTSATTGYGYTLSLTQSSGSVGTTTIWVRLKSGKSVDTYVDNITISGGTATSKEVIIGGEVTAGCSVNPSSANATINSSFVLTSLTDPVSVSSGTWGAGSNCSWTDYGFVWGTSSSPTVSNNKVQVGTSGNATSWTTGAGHQVQPSGSTTPTAWVVGNTYYVKAYGKNGKAGAAYVYSGSAASFVLRSITFNSNGGTSIGPWYVKGGQAYSAPSPAPTKTGYNFVEWCSNEGLTTPVNWSSTIGANKVYYAKWAAKTTTISFNQTSGTGGQTGTLTATYGSAMPSAPVTVPTRDGYDFGGYYDGSGGTGTQYYTNTGASARNWDKENATYTLHAKWTLKSYTVTWKVNNENYSAGGSDNVTHGNHITTLPTAPNRPTYGCGDVFVGWTNVQNYVHGTSPLYTTAAEFPNATGDQVFYAVYADYTTD